MASPPSHGALGVTFTVTRVLQFAALITIIGLTSNFIAEVVNGGFESPSALIGTLVVACLATVYLVITYILYWDSMLPFLLTTAADTAALVAVIVVACVLGRPVSYLNCRDFPSEGNTANFVNSLFHNVYHSRNDVFMWVDADRGSCTEIKVVWGMSISLCVLFFFSAVTTGCGRGDAAAATAPPRVLRKGPSLGTLAVAHGERRFDSDASDTDSTASRRKPVPWFPPPPTAPIREKKKTRVREAPQPVEEMPPLPPLPPAHAMLSPKVMGDPFPPRKPLARMMSKRKTLLERIEGWWDLGLLEKRQTLAAGGGLNIRSPLSPRA
ncbi:hypothetical protein B0I35DRAFT_508651 [Stachybotrys elegans]|uniref:MARVEL domain-containing protein n=1 Tax=Stachybotrys elegans TaxID=80388 RepID=A0A8K0T0Y1_9HYPO|nr:hypothetical protein B0I35DRAFT_508651 [Stachybotrys elegans]